MSVPMNKIKRTNLHVQSESDDLLVKRQNDKDLFYICLLSIMVYLLGQKFLFRSDVN